MKQTLILLLQEFESSSGKTPQFMAFCRVFKKDFLKFLSRYFAENVSFSIGHFEISGFFTIPKQNQVYYFSLGDVRWYKSMFVRTAKDYKDYTGGRNQNINLDSELSMQLSFDRIIFEY